MLFNTPTYGIFLLAVFILFWASSGRRRMSHLLLLAASYFFYGCWNIKYLVLIFFVTVLNFLVGVLLQKENRSGRRKLYVTIGIVGSLAVLAVFKYYDFFLNEVSWFFAFFDVQFVYPSLNLLLPVGISFYTFQSLSYTIDLYRGEIEPCESFLEFALFVSFFPQLVAGPIVRAKQFLPQLRTVRPYSEDGVSSGLFQILQGLVKKIIIADYLGAHLVDIVFADPTKHGSLTVMLAIYGFAFQIYGDFCGYTDIAIGSARMLGYELPVNFNKPYLAEDLRDFWRRWHISLSTWLRDYLYIPLGGSHRGTMRTYLNLMITMFLGGLWHGAAWTFAIWGLYHGGLLALTRLIQRRFPRTNREKHSFFITLFKTVFTFHLVCFGWLVFRAESFAQVGVVLRQLVYSGDWSLAVGNGVLFVLAFAAITHCFPGKWGDIIEARFVSMPAVAQGLVLAVVLGVFNLLNATAHPFIYFQF